MISDRCLMDHNLQETVSHYIGNCSASEVFILRGADMFECTTCTEMCTYCVDCKRAADLRPSFNQRQQNALARCCGQALYELTPSRQPSERYVPAVGGENKKENQNEENKEKKNKRSTTS